jgi:hypothetical protein
MSRSRAVEVPGSIGPVAFEHGVGWVVVRCPRQYLVPAERRRAGCVASPARQVYPKPKAAKAAALTRGMIVAV